jgi:predicted nucleic-acid-binding protein
MTRNQTMIEPPDTIYILTAPMAMSQEQIDKVIETLVLSLKSGIVVMTNGCTLAVHKIR